MSCWIKFSSVVAVVGDIWKTNERPYDREIEIRQWIGHGAMDN